MNENQTYQGPEIATPEGNYITGTIGAFLGMLIGSLPAILVSYFGGWIVFILYIFIPYAIFYGYRLLKGRISNVTYIITILFSILGMVWTHVANELITCVKLGFNITESFAMIFNRFTQAYYWQEVVTNEYIAIICIVVGIGYVVKEIKNSIH